MQLLRFLSASALLLVFAPATRAQDLLISDFSGSEPALHTPWTSTSLLAPGLSFSGWTLGSGLEIEAGVDDALGFSVDVGSDESNIAAAVSGGDYVGFTLTPTTGVLDLGGMQVRFTVRRLEYHSPRGYSLLTNLDGFSAETELFSTALVDHQTFYDVEHTFIFPLTGYDGITGPVEFRLYGTHARYGGHGTSLRDFRIVDPGPLVSLNLSAQGGGSVQANPPGGLYAIGTTVSLSASPDATRRFAGWSGDLSGRGNPRQVTLNADAVISANFESTAHAGMALGTNLSSNRDWMTQWLFVDQMKSARAWLTREVGDWSIWDSGKAGELPSDADGWPLALPFQAADGTSHYVHTLLPALVPGEHTLMVEGTGSLEILDAASTGQIQLSGGQTVVPLQVSSPGWFALNIYSSSAADPVRNIRVVMPGFEQTYATQVFHPTFLQSLSRFENLRFMDLGETNNHWIQSWSSRTTLTSFTQAGNGIAYELMADLANRRHADAWICIPHQADDDYVRQCARVMRDHLSPGLRLWVEYSNETWNPIFTQTQYTSVKGTELGLDSDSWVAGHEYAALRSVQIWEIFEQEFVNDSRLVRVLATQSSFPYVTLLRVNALNDPALNPGATMPDVLAIAPYFGRNYTLNDIPPRAKLYPDVDRLFRGQIRPLIAGLQQEIDAQRAIAEVQGMDLVCYEAGQHFVGVGGAENDATLVARLFELNRDPRMAGAYSAYLELLGALGLTLCDHFTHCGGWSKWGTWGSLEYQDQPLSRAPKARAIQQFVPRPYLP